MKVGGWFVLGVSGYLVIGYWLLVAEVQCKSSTGWYILYERNGGILTSLASLRFPVPSKTLARDIPVYLYNVYICVCMYGCM